MSQLVRAGTCLALLATLTGPPAAAQLKTERVASGLTNPVYVTAPAGDTERLFILEQRGLIKILKNGSLLARPFLDIQDKVNDAGSEQGLLGLAFHPDYANNGFLYVYFTNNAGFAGASVIRRFTVTADPDSADPSTLFKILKIVQPFTNHNGGHIEFGDDGFLYVGMGDGGSGGDPGNRAQNGNELLGKMLRIDVNGDDFPADDLQNYAIPASNPFVGDPGFRDEIWAYGLRNPYRWSFDRANGDLYIADVGQNLWEEVDFQPASSSGGENYGWRLMEGNHCFNPPTNCNDGSLVLPIHEYGHGGGPCSITGGYVYRGSALPGAQGVYFFADFCSSQIWSFRYDGSTVSEFAERTSELAPGGGLSIDNISGFGEDGTGELYIIDYGLFSNGEVYKIIPDPVFVGAGPRIEEPTELVLTGGRPNPFTRETSFEVLLARPGDLEVSVFTAAGRLVRRLHAGTAAAGVVPLAWNGRDGTNRTVPAGVYFLRAAFCGRVVTERLTLLR